MPPGTGIPPHRPDAQALIPSAGDPATPDRRRPRMTPSNSFDAERAGRHARTRLRAGRYGRGRASGTVRACARAGAPHPRNSRAPDGAPRARPGKAAPPRRARRCSRLGNRPGHVPGRTCRQGAGRALPA